MKQLGNDKTENDYALESFFSSTVDSRYVISFVTLDSSAVYENFNSKSVQNLNLNIYFRVFNGTCAIVDQTNLEVKIQENVFSLMNLNVNLRGKYENGSNITNTYGSLIYP